MTRAQKFCLDRLTQMRDRPEMWSATCVDFALQLVLLFEMFFSERDQPVTSEQAQRLLAALVKNIEPLALTTAAWASPMADNMLHDFKALLP